MRTPTEFVLDSKLLFTNIFPAVFALETCSNEEKVMELKKECTTPLI